jgi:hypothetical protein
MSRLAHAGRARQQFPSVGDPQPFASTLAGPSSEGSSSVMEPRPTRSTSRIGILVVASTESAGAHLGRRSACYGERAVNAHLGEA